MLFAKHILLLFLICIGFLISSNVNAQCCAQGSPATGSSNAGIMDESSLRLISFYRYSYADKYYNVNKPVNFNFLKKSDYHYWGNIISYGITKKITAETEIGYYLQKQQIIDDAPPMQLKGNGLNNAVVSLKYPILKSSIKNYEWTIGAGMKIPFQRTPISKDNVTLPVDVQPSTLAYGHVFQSFFYKGLKNDSIRLIVINRMELNYENKYFYQYGNTISNSLFVTFPLYKSWSGIIQTRHEFKEMNKSAGLELTNTGGHIVFVSPQINYAFGNNWNASLLAEIPVWRYYKGTQLGNKYSLAINLSRTICL